ncbi:L-asparaginase/beta-aspartyl-peptidase (threonine type) [Pseudoduganella namucuonensis]|uniref:L-asparaginase/beta-aspartyl-peptidase (Threonine type) n=2 Tax=Pseudoduganella namucuonensis TaxID=1035707 RepID=A0A1I7M3B5_9BURK|nr:L-asparaginase/beta-aspartyl-peptidase (threonine type) [Pseudoduganella namucuonensis]
MQHATDYAPVIVVHGGAGANELDKDGCLAAARAGLDALGDGGLAAAVAAVAALEDDGRFNAGSGAVLCLDGKTVEMDAAVMDSLGALGAVACVRHVKNPVWLAHAVSRTPHWLLAGEGADSLARTLGLPPSGPPGERALRRHAKLLERLRGKIPELPGIDNGAFERFWNYETPAGAAGSGGANDGACDTVGAVVRDASGAFAVASSTGGSAPSLLGRVGDTPIIGGGFYAGPAGAVAATGLGEHIVRHLLAHTVYRWIEGGVPLAQALERGVGLFEPRVPIGLIAVGKTESGWRSNRDMPVAELRHD